jgi:hypothetical protein
MDSEAIQKLYWYVGALVARIVQFNIKEVRLVTPNEWKGSVPKDVHHRRIRERYNIPTGSTDVVDAVGIALKDWHSNQLGVTIRPDRGIVGAVTDMRSWIVNRKELQENATLGPKAPGG